jgi:acyl dehydratase
MFLRDQVYLVRTDLLSFEDLKEKLGSEVGVSRWFTIDQERIDEFADLTEDWQYIHINSVAAKKTPFNGTIAHGFLTVSLLSAMYYDAIPMIEGSKLGVNYGFDKLRFLSPVKVGSKVRGRFELSDIREVRPLEISTTWRVEVEIENFEKPALVAYWIGRQYLSEGLSQDG